jgi:hypothetical protein
VWWLTFHDRPRPRPSVPAENGRRGLAFNKSVAEAFATAGWRVEIELQMTRLQAPQKEASGDIDVLAVKDGTVYICECKELLIARTITEVVEQLGRFRGNPGDALWKHARRVEWVRSHPQRLSKIIGQEPREIRSLRYKQNRAHAVRKRFSSPSRCDRLIREHFRMTVGDGAGWGSKMRRGSEPGPIFTVWLA